MPLIKIEELDLTSAGNRSQENDVIYIPGLVDINQSDLYVEGEYIGLKPFEPTYIEDLSTFKTLVGDRGVVFEKDQLYTDLTEEIDDEYFGFDENAIPYSKVMLRKGQVDPSYVMAKELLAAGLPIVYERINKDPVLEKVTSKPDGWDVLDQFGHGIYENYFQNITGYKHIQSTTPPKLFVKYTTYDENLGAVETTTSTTTTTKVASTSSNVILDWSNFNGYSEAKFKYDKDDPTGYIHVSGTKTTSNESQILDLLNWWDWSAAGYDKIKFTAYTGSGSCDIRMVYGQYGSPTANATISTTPTVVTYDVTSTASGDIKFQLDAGAKDATVDVDLYISDVYGVKAGAVDLYEREEKDGVYTYSRAAAASSDLIVPEGKTYYYKTDIKVYKPGSVPLKDPVKDEELKGTIYSRTSNDDGTFGYLVLEAKPDDWGTGIYYKKIISSYELVKDNDPEDDLTISFEQGKYYKFENDKYILLGLEPEDWDTNATAYYTAVFKYEEINYVDYLASTDVYVFREDLDLYVKIDKGNITDYEYSDLFAFKKYPEEISATEYQIRKDFINKFTDYCEEASSLESLEDKEFVKFEDSDIYINNQYLDIKSIYDSLSEVFSLDRDNGLTDMGNINIKYITSGGYPTYEYRGNEIATKMIKVAKTRGDAIAFIDHTNNSDRTTNVSQPNSLYAVVKNDSSIQADGEFGTMFTPYMNFIRTTKDDTIAGQSYNPQIEMSGTYAYLMCLANSIKVNPAWLAVAGAARGLVPNLQQVATNTPISNGNADKMQPRDGVSINAITEIKPYGYTIWGNRTLKNNGTEGNLKATSFLNIRNLVCDIKKVAYSTARALTFEQNNDILWVNFQSKLTPTLDRMKSGYGISGYKIVRNTDHPKATEKATLCADIIIYPTYAVEDFYITVVLTDDEVGVEE